MKFIQKIETYPTMKNNNIMDVFKIKILHLIVGTLT